MVSRAFLSLIEKGELDSLCLQSTLPPASKNAAAHVSFSEVQKHTTRDSCWVIIEGQIYDATSILDTHPGGAAVLLKNSGKDATYVCLTKL